MSVVEEKAKIYYAVGGEPWASGKSC